MWFLTVKLAGTLFRQSFTHCRYWVTTWKSEWPNLYSRYYCQEKPNKWIPKMTGVRKLQEDDMGYFSCKGAARRHIIIHLLIQQKFEELLWVRHSCSTHVCGVVCGVQISCHKLTSTKVGRQTSFVQSTVLIHTIFFNQLWGIIYLQ